MKTLSLLVLALLTAAASPVHAADEKVSDIPNAFAVDLLRALRATEGNLFFSPYSVHVALTMTREGARGETAAEMDRVLHLPWDTDVNGHRLLSVRMVAPEVRDGHGRDAKKVEAYELSKANALWGQEGLAFEKPFLRTLADSYGAPLERIDFRKSREARERINGWVADHTRDRIQNIIPEGLPPPDCLLALANAIYFKASWNKPFDERQTKSRRFFPTPKMDMVVPTMHTVDSLGYAETDEFQAVELPYRGRHTSMVVLLPRGWAGTDRFEEALDAAKLYAILGSLKRQRVAVWLPKFNITCPLDLTGTLPKMGMKLAFSRRADFTGITRQDPLMIGAVLHKAFVAVDEAGTEAAAATVVLMIRGGPPPGTPVEFRADRPFLFLIRHRETGTILFMGRLVNPNEG